MMMTKNKKRRIMKYKQKQLNQVFASIFIRNLMIVLMILFAVSVKTSKNNEIEGEYTNTVYESNDHDTVTSPANALSNSSEVKQEVESNIVEYNRGLSTEDQYLLAKIAMAEAESESLETKVLVVLTVLNRVESNEFPNTVEDVIFQKLNGVYQFTPICDGRWDRVEPNDECWEAVNIVNTNAGDPSEGALYFEACVGESWHSMNLELICQSDNTRFYK